MCVTEIALVFLGRTLELICGPTTVVNLKIIILIHGGLECAARGPAISALVISFLQSIAVEQRHA